MNELKTTTAGARTQNFGTPRVCNIQPEILEDNSVVFDVVFLEERIFCRDQKAAEQLYYAINEAVKEAQ